MKITTKLDKVLVEHRMAVRKDDVEGDLWEDFCEMIQWFISKPKYQEKKKLARTVARILVGIRLVVFNMEIGDQVQDEIDRIQLKLVRKPRDRRSRR